MRESWEPWLDFKAAGDPLYVVCPFICIKGIKWLQTWYRHSFTRHICQLEDVLQYLVYQIRNNLLHATQMKHTLHVLWTTHNCDLSSVCMSCMYMCLSVLVHVVRLFGECCQDNCSQWPAGHYCLVTAIQTLYHTKVYSCELLFSCSYTHPFYHTEWWDSTGPSQLQWSPQGGRTAPGSRGQHWPAEQGEH